MSKLGIIYEMNVRQLTQEGTFKSAEKELARLKKMGVDIIWLMPVYPIGKISRKGTLGSYYSIQNYTEINPEFGTKENFDSFVQKAHSLGLKVILDWVANHTSRDNEWLRTKPMEWYERDAQGSAVIPWDWTDTAKLNYSNHDVWIGQREAMQYWLQEHGVDGFRCDMAMLVPLDFWKETFHSLKTIKDDIILLAEAEGREFTDGVFDICYGWELHHALVDLANGRTDVDKVRNIVYNYLNYPNGSSHLYFTSNHDENSWSGSSEQRFKKSLRCISALTFMLPAGTPLIYTGEEYGYDHSFNFFEKDSMPSMKKNDVTRFYEKMCALRHSLTSLDMFRSGDNFMEIITNASRDLFAFRWQNSEKEIICIFNVSPWVIEGNFDVCNTSGIYMDYLSGKEIEIQNHFHGFLDPWEFLLLQKK